MGRRSGAISNAERCEWCSQRYVYIEAHRAKCARKDIPFKQSAAARANMAKAARARWADPEQRMLASERQMAAQATAKRRKISLGHWIGDQVGVNVYFDPDTFSEIRAIAVSRETALAAVVRELVEWGLETHREDQRGRT